MVFCITTNMTPGQETRHDSQQGNSGGWHERTPEDCLATICALVKKQAEHQAFRPSEFSFLQPSELDLKKEEDGVEQQSAWAALEKVLFDLDTMAFLRQKLGRLAEVATEAGVVPAGGASAAGPGADTHTDTICDHCGCSIPEISLSVSALDGLSQEVTVAQSECVGSIKRIILDDDQCPSSIALFIKDSENALPDSERSHRLGNGAALFMLPRPGWIFTAASGIGVSGDGLVATKLDNHKYPAVTGGLPMRHGRHYWEVEITCSVSASRVEHMKSHPGQELGTLNQILIGCAPAYSGHADGLTWATGAYYLDVQDGSLCGGDSEVCYSDAQGGLVQGDRVGILLDFTEHFIHFYRNGKQYGPGFSEAFRYPETLVRAVQMDGMHGKGDTVTIVPDAVDPGIGGISHTGKKQKTGLSSSTAPMPAAAAPQHDVIDLSS
jgi:hypothetical protein